LFSPPALAGADWPLVLGFLRVFPLPVALAWLPGVLVTLRFPALGAWLAPSLIGLQSSLDLGRLRARYCLLTRWRV